MYIFFIAGILDRPWVALYISSTVHVDLCHRLSPYYKHKCVVALQFNIAFSFCTFADSQIMSKVIKISITVFLTCCLSVSLTPLEYCSSILCFKTKTANLLCLSVNHWSVRFLKKAKCALKWGKELQGGIGAMYWDKLYGSGGWHQC